MIFNDLDALIRLEQLGREGFTISIACGPCGDKPFAWSVDVLAPIGESFDRPYEATSFTHAIVIVDAEIRRRGWRGRAPTDTPLEFETISISNADQEFIEQQIVRPAASEKRISKGLEEMLSKDWNRRS